MIKAAQGSGGAAKAGSRGGASGGGSIFDKNDETRQHFQFLKELLAPDYILSNYFELENFIVKNDAKMRFLILRNFKNREHSQTALAKLETFARLNGLPAEFFKYNSLYSDYRLQGAKVDEAIHLMYQRHPLEDVSQATGIDMFTLDQLKNCAEIYNNNFREQRSNFDYIATDFVGDFSKDLYHLYAEDTTTRITNFNMELKQGFEHEPRYSSRR
jgi:hypothetical protein